MRPMATITIPAFPRDSEPVSLRSLLHALGPEVKEALWEVRDIESAGTTSVARQLEEASDKHLTITGTALQKAAEDGAQIIEGELVGTKQGRHWVIIRAVDSTWWDVDADSHTLQRLISLPGAELRE